MSEKVTKQRFNQIKEFEELLYENGTGILKFFLHISKDEQKKRLEARVAGSGKALEVEFRRLGRTEALG